MSSSQNGSSSWVQMALRMGFFALRHRPWRRKLMFYLTLGAMGQLAFGVLILDTLAKSLLLFALYWGFCAFVVCTMLLLAIYDMMAVRQEQRVALLQLRERMLAEQRDELGSHADDQGDA